jgi:hypothetical protein
MKGNLNMAIYRSCYECGRTLGPDEKVVTTEMQFWTFPASGAAEDEVESIETRTVDLCEEDAAFATKEA